MSQTGLESFDRTLHQTHMWLNDLGESDAVGPDKQRQYHALRAVLWALRDRLTVEEAPARNSSSRWKSRSKGRFS